MPAIRSLNSQQAEDGKPCFVESLTDLRADSSTVTVETLEIAHKGMKKLLNE